MYMYTMEVRQSRLPVMPPNYVTLNDLKERYLKEQQERKQREAEEAAADKAVLPAMPIENNSVVDRLTPNRVSENENRERKGKAVIVEGEDVKRREIAEKAVIVEGEDGNRREKAYAEETRRTGALHAEKRERGRWREKQAAEEGEEGGYRRRRERAAAETENVEEGGYRKRREKEERGRRERFGSENKIGAKGKAEETLGEEADSARLEERDNRKNREKKNKGKKKINSNNINNNNKATDNVEEEKVLAALRGREEERERVVINGRVWMKMVTWVEVDPTDQIELGFGDYLLKDFKKENLTNETELKTGDDKKDVQAENGRRIGNNSKNDRKKGKGKGFRKNTGGDRRVEDLSVVVEDEKNVLGDRRAENGRGDDPTAEIAVKIGGFATSDKVKGGESIDVKENIEGGKMGMIRRINGDKNRGNGGRNGVWGGLGRYKGLDSSLVWVRKEEKSEVCVAGNCSEGMLAKAGESEKRPGRGRP